MTRSTVPGSDATASGRAGKTRAATGLERIEAAVGHARAEAPARVDSAQFLMALAMLRQMREQLASWEPELIDAARANGASWVQLAPALGVASRQAAERRALRLRQGADGAATSGDQRVREERGRRAGARAVDAWARAHAADLRVLAARVGALTGLPAAADASLAALHEALGGADAAALVQPLVDARPHLAVEHADLAARIDELVSGAERARAEVRRRRR